MDFGWHNMLQGNCLHKATSAALKKPRIKTYKLFTSVFGCGCGCLLLSRVESLIPNPKEPLRIRIHQLKLPKSPAAFSFGKQKARPHDCRSAIHSHSQLSPLASLPVRYALCAKTAILIYELKTNEFAVPALLLRVGTLSHDTQVFPIKVQEL